MWHRFPQPMRDVILRSLEDASRHHRLTAEPQDLLAGIVRTPHCAATHLLRERSFQAAGQSTGDEKLTPAAELSAAAVCVVEQAYRESVGLKDRVVGTDHLLLALLKLHPGLPPLSGVRYDQVLAGIRKLRRLGIGPDAPIASLNPVAGLARRLRSALRVLPQLYKLYVQLSAAHPRLVTDPYPLYDRMRRRGVVRRDPIMPLWVVTGYAEVAQVFRDPRFSSLPLSHRSPNGLLEIGELPAGPVRGQLGVITNVLTRMMVFSDDPAHARTRAQLGQMFSPRNVAGLRPAVQQIADELIDAVVGAGRMDFIRDFACPLPLYIVSDVLGLRRSDWRQLKEWSDVFGTLLSFRTTLEQDLHARSAMMEMRRYFDDVIAGVRAQPDASLLSQLVNPPAGATQIDLDDLFGNVVFMLAAGHETTTSVLGNGLRALLNHPDQLQRLQEDPSLINTAVEELLRLESPVQWTRRRATEDVELGGQLIQQGDVVIVSMGAANRDPRQFPDPHRLDVTRKDASKNLAFSGGSHYCLGAGLARIELQVGLTTLLRRLCDIRVVEGFKLNWRKGHTLRSFDSLPITFRVATQNQPGAHRGDVSQPSSFERRRGTTANATSG
jgi:hypothetical protein